MRYFKELTVCIYCGDDQSPNSLGCCGESNQHFETRWYECNVKGHVIDDVEYTEKEVDEIYDEQDRTESFLWKKKKE